MTSRQAAGSPGSGPTTKLVITTFPTPPTPNFMYFGGSSGKALTDKSPSGSGFGWSPDPLFHDQLEKFAKVPVTNRDIF